MKRFDLMWSVNGRGTFACSQAAIPHLKRSANPHILNLSPPLNLNPKWFANHCAYTMAKYGMSLAVLGMAAEWKDDGIAVNALWPRTAIATAALAMLGGMVKPENCRKPEIVADAAHVDPHPGQPLLHGELLHRRRGAGVGGGQRSRSLCRPAGNPALQRLLRRLALPGAFFEGGGSDSRDPIKMS